ncbi:AraC family transcriptional regulator [Enterococcus faecalis]|uniref:AraC family transcriptional regulator n=1 Tax=Enterococcus faecalis TaxID=1351 RepID=UPI0020919814|nr:helix-turn-helix domain-containing protein [Enterococcus faecalis]MCO5541992.1 helix-turn-helix domain-containing protein [Enterococcus faecalis]
MEDFWYHNKSVSTPISLSQCGYESYHPDSSIRNYIVQQKWIFHYVLSGKGVLEVGTQHFELKKHDIFFFFQGQKVKYYTDKKQPWTLIWLGIQGDKTYEFLKETPLLNIHTANLTEKMNKQLKNILLKIVCENRELIEEPETVKELRNIASVYNFLYHIKKIFWDPTSITNKPTQINIIDYINNNYMNDISPEKIARYFNISYSQLYKLCISNFNSSPKKIITNHRIRVSIDLLLYSDNTIKEIAQKVGYKDEFLFSKTFSKTLGYCPSKFRKLNKNQLKNIRFK